MSSRQIERRLDELNSRFERLNERIGDILTVKEPGTGHAAEAFEGLRRSVIANGKERREHLAHLARIDLAIESGEQQDALRLLLRELMSSTGLQRVTAADENTRFLFDVVDEGDGPLEVVMPAYVDVAPNGQVNPIMTGMARTRPPAPVDTPELAPAVEDGGSDNGEAIA